MQYSPSAPLSQRLHPFTPLRSNNNISKASPRKSSSSASSPKKHVDVRALSFEHSHSNNAGAGDENSAPQSPTVSFPSWTHQKVVVEAERRRRHQSWCEQHEDKQRFDHKSSEIRAMFLVGEAYRLEKSHLQHQLAYCQRLVRQQDADTSSPSRMRCESEKAEDCACLRAPVYRQLTPKYRAMNLLAPHFANLDLERTIDSLQNTYENDHEMMEDLLSRYGPEDPEVDPHIWLKSIRHRQSQLKSKWDGIAKAVRNEFRVRDNFTSVIRNLSIMRIFLEGSQSPTYSCDSTERLRRDAFHQSVLMELQRDGKLFI